MAYSYSFCAIYTWNAWRKKTSCYQIEVVRDDPDRRVKIHYGTEHDEWKDDMKLRHCRLQLKVGSIWNKLTIVQFGSFYSSASKRIGQKPDHWNHTNQIFSDLQYLAVFKYRLHFLIRYPELELGSDETVDLWPPTEVLMTIGQKFEGPMVIVLVSSWSK